MTSKKCRQICRNFLALTSCKKASSLFQFTTGIAYTVAFKIPIFLRYLCHVHSIWYVCIMHELFLVCYPISYGSVCKTSWMALVFQLCLHLWDFYPNFRRILNSSTALSESYNLDDSRARAYCACSRCGWGLFGHFLLSSIFSLLFLSLTRRRLDID